jgi:hypothetical protein
MTTFGSNVARFEGTADSFTPLADLDAPVNAMMNAINGLIVGGSFSTNSGAALPFLAQTQISTGVHAPAYAQGPVLFPNPATTQLTITVDRDVPARSVLEVLDAQGRPIFSRGFSERTTTVDIADLVPGTYLVRTVMNGAAASRPFIKR